MVEYIINCKVHDLESIKINKSNINLMFIYYIEKHKINKNRLKYEKDGKN